MFLGAGREGAVRIDSGRFGLKKAVDALDSRWVSSLLNRFAGCPKKEYVRLTFKVKFRLSL